MGIEVYEPFSSLAVAVGLGLIIGLEREHRAGTDTQMRGSAPGGARTYPLIALSGAIAMMAAEALGLWIVGLVLAGLLGLILTAYSDDIRNNRDRGITSETAMVLTFLLGVLVMSKGVLDPLPHRLIVVSSMGVAITTLLSFKDPLHGFAKRISRDDIYSTLKFLVVLVIVLPLLPDQAMGPFEAFNPFTTGVMIVLVAALGFVGYVAMRILGPGRGLGVTGLIGGLVSSTAVTLSMSDRARREPAISSGCTLAIVLASTVMFGRILAIVAVLNVSLLRFVAFPMSAMMLGGAIATGMLYRGSRPLAAAEEVHFKNPFELGSALKFGVLFSVVLIASKAGPQYFGSSGSYITGLVSGAAEVDAITISMSRLAHEGLDPNIATTTILIAAISNTAVKAGMALAVGGWSFGRKMLAAFAFMLLLGSGGLLLALAR